MAKQKTIICDNCGHEQTEIELFENNDNCVKCGKPHDNYNDDFNMGLDFFEEFLTQF